MADAEVTTPGNPSGDTEIDLYADVVENELDTETGDNYGTHDEHFQHLAQDNDLYDDVITTQSSVTDFTDITNTVNQNSARMDQMNGFITSGNSSSNSYAGKRVSLYVGQLTWWTTDMNLVDAIHELGINDLLEVKFHENRVNGQSKGFAVVTVGSDASSRIILEKMPKKEIHGQPPTVLPCNKQSLSFFEGTTRKDGPMESVPPMNAPPPRPMGHQQMRLPFPMHRGGPMDGSYRFPPQGSVLLPGGMAPSPMQMGLGLRGPLPGNPMVLNRMPGAHPQQPVILMPSSQRPGLPHGAIGSCCSSARSTWSTRCSCLIEFDVNDSRSTSI
ncbi:hypothetical protein I4U23_019258 [Adineta vaga]|nr:hypothetical protein I4U23_019258 [Adineta vaga]